MGQTHEYEGMWDLSKTEQPEAMTTHTPLAETIARVERENARLPVGSCPVSQADLTALLSCARRCLAIDNVDPDVARESLRKMEAQIETMIPQHPKLPTWWYQAQRDMVGTIQAAIDAASERDALAKRVAEYERINSEILSINFKANEEVTRLREELANSEARTKEQAGLASRALDREQAALDRVRELEGELGGPPTHDAQDVTGEVDTVCDGCGDNVDPETHSWAVCVLGLRQHRDRLIDACIDAEMKNAGPITDPTQGTETCPACGDQRVFSCALPSPSQGVGTMGSLAEVKLPSGITARVWGDSIRIEHDDGPSYIFAACKTREAAYLNGPAAPDVVSEEDFLTARAFGKKVLGWE